MIDYTITESFPIALFSAFDFAKGNNVLWVDFEEKLNNDVLNEFFKLKGINISFATCNCVGEIVGESNDISTDEPTNVVFYDYVIISSIFETVKEQKRLLGNLKSVLREKGTLFLLLNNPIGLRYIIGDKDPYTDRNFDSVEEYLRVNAIDRDNLKGRMIDKADACALLNEQGFNKPVQYSVFPNLEYPQLIYREDFLPNEEINARIFPMYNSPDTIFLNEYILLKKLMKNGMFHEFANAYILECSLDEHHEQVVHATVNMNRGRDNAMSTVIKENGVVEKTAIFPEGKSGLARLKKNHDLLRERGINVLNVELVGDRVQTKYIDGTGAIEYFGELFDRVSREDFIAKVDEFRDIILNSSETFVDDKSGEIILKNGYPDIALINCIYKDDVPHLFDQEYVIPNLPAKVLIMRLVDYVYHGNNKLAKELPRSFFEERYGLTDNQKEWRDTLQSFMNKLKNQNVMEPVYEKHRTNEDILNANRQRMNYSQEEYKKLFDDIFAGLRNKELFLFGSGLFAERFINLYGRFVNIEGIIDNNSEKWGTSKNDIMISSPDVLLDKNPSEYKVIICIKNYTAVLKQLKAAGVKNISVFDPNGIYDLKKLSCDAESDKTTFGSGNGKCNAVDKQYASENKKYNIGYIAGVFDLFHIGHLNLLRRAKEQCNHLIVGVVNDEAVVKNKRVEPFVPFDERIEMVRACKYVDEAVEITYTNAGTKDAYRLYHFDVQFSGSDYVNNGDWLAEKEFLEKNGAELVFFPYTEQTSSTKIKKLIEEKLV